MNSPANGPEPGTTAPQSPPVSSRHIPLRVWPALVLVALMVLARYGPGYLTGGLSTYWMIAVFGPVLCGVLMVVWWMVASRATWKEKGVGLLGLIVALGVTLVLVDPTMRGPGTRYLTVPMGMMAFALGAALFRRRGLMVRTGYALLMAFAGFGFSLVLRNEGMTGHYTFGLLWRWTQTPEEAMLAGRGGESADPALVLPESGGADLALARPEWPGFRGAERDGRARGPQISTNWAGQPPRALWKISVGPAWSSFAVAGKLLFTQEQRGPMETAVCYDADTGREIWTRQIETRLEDPMGGPGPRATPTLAGGGLFITGATGVLMRLDPATGGIVWQQDLKAVAGCEVPMWGFSASPLVAGSLVIVHAGGPGDKGVLAFDTGSGDLRWSAAAGKESYSSPQWNTIAGQDLVLMLSNEGLLFLDPVTGEERLDYKWKFIGYRALQPSPAGEGVFLLPTGLNLGTRAIRITSSHGQLAAEELWTSRNLKPDFTDLVVYQGCAYGVDGGIFTCVDLATGERKWKGGRYGKGQVLLLEDSGLLLVAAEQGSVVLLRADPGGHVELGSFQALSGKTWNHPVVVGDRLYVRNAQEAAAYVLTLAGGI